MYLVSGFAAGHKSLLHSALKTPGEQPKNQTLLHDTTMQSLRFNFDTNIVYHITIQLRFEITDTNKTGQLVYLLN